MKAFLEHFPELGGPAKRVEIAGSPFIIGRSRSADLTIYSQKVSKEHALIFQGPSGHAIRDLSSTNGTFVNGSRVDEVSLNDGDIIHLAHWEFGYCFGPGRHARHTITAPLTQQQTLAHEKESLIRTSVFLQEMVSDESVFTLFQTIVDLRSGVVIGCEALGRGRHHHLHQSPVKLFELAEKCQMERELCRLFRNQALKAGEDLPSRFRLFLNIHPSELARPDFFVSLEQLASRNRGRHQLVIEVSERFVTDLSGLRILKQKLTELSMEIAYDDFGSGQARLLELAECPPHFLKLDRSLIQGMESSEASRELIRAFLLAISDSHIQVIAEGIETEEVARICLECGCHLGQGFFYSQPASLLDIAALAELDASD
ncbi:MAG TPA: EAL domain-containing protein [Isosphaeraceae bacterium]|nr:EAL domain-containing protein [Isosphaeraceae bacterium]